MSTPALPQTSKLLLIRSAESQGNLSGTITGWMDVRLSDFGRKQAFQINQVLDPYIFRFNSIHSSDLRRSNETAFYALGFPSDESIIKQSKELREMNFGEKEGLHFDGLSEKEKEELRNPKYQAPGGENWDEVRERAMKKWCAMGKGQHLVFTHGGLMCACLSELGVETIVNNCSFIGITVKPELKKVQKVDFIWEFPTVEEDI